MEYMELNALENKIDILNRDKFIEDVKNIILKLSERRSNACFAIDGTWGVGKTYILEKLEKMLEVEQSEETNDNRYFVFHYNCWEYDYYEEPSIAIVSAMKDKFSEDIEQEIKDNFDATWKYVKGKLKEISGEFIKNKIGVNPVEIYNGLHNIKENRKENENKFDNMFAFKETISYMRTKIKEIAKEKTLVLVVDELDRCMPSYAIKVLERIHHIFDSIDNVIVLLAVDSTQLEHSVKEIYGSSVNTERYLKKFINFSVKLSIGEKQHSIFDKYDKYFSCFDNIDEIQESVEEFFTALSLDVRTLDKTLENLILLHSLVCEKKIQSSVLWFEMVIAFMRTKMSFIHEQNDNIAKLKNNYYWIPEIDRSTYVDLDICIGERTITFLKEAKKYSRTSEFSDGDNGRKQYLVHENSLGIGFFLLDYILAEGRNLTVKDGESKYQDLINICINFKNFAELIL